MSDRAKVTQEQLKKVIHYEPDTGIFTWIEGLRKGFEAGNLDIYRVIWIAGQRYHASKLAWLYMAGEFPECIIDHKNTIKADDSWANLRKATLAQNNHNRASYSLLGAKGVSRSGNRFKVEINVEGRSLYLGHYETVELASAAYEQAAKEHYGEFAYVSSK